MAEPSQEGHHLITLQNIQRYHFVFWDEVDLTSITTEDKMIEGGHPFVEAFPFFFVFSNGGP